MQFDSMSQVIRPSQDQPSLLIFSATRDNLEDLDSSFHISIYQIFGQLLPIDAYIPIALAERSCSLPCGTMVRSLTIFVEESKHLGIMVMTSADRGTVLRNYLKLSGLKGPR